MANRKWRSATFAELAAKEAGNALSVQNAVSANGSLDDANFWPEEPPQVGAKYSEAWTPESSSDGLTVGATSQVK